jgi:hypothetical protein
MAETASSRKRRHRRDVTFPGSAALVRSSSEVGWFKAPRALPFVMQLLREKELVGTTSCDQVYLELLARDPGEGFIEAVDEQDHAFMAGYSTNRAVRTWRERMIKLKELGFIQVAPKMNRDFAYILLVDPQKAIAKLETKQWSEATKKLMAGFHQRRREVGAEAEERVPLSPEEHAPLSPEDMSIILDGIVSQG